METHILVVDDEPEIADLVEVYLQSEGFTIHKCGSGTAALEVVRSVPLDLAIQEMKDGIYKSYFKKAGQKVVDMNYRAVERGISDVESFEIPADWADAPDDAPV